MPCRLYFYFHFSKSCDFFFIWLYFFFTDLRIKILGTYILFGPGRCAPNNNPYNINYSCLVTTAVCIMCFVSRIILNMVCGKTIVNCYMKVMFVGKAYTCWWWTYICKMDRCKKYCKTYLSKDVVNMKQYIKFLIQIN